MAYLESSNHRPGEPLRLRVDDTPVRDVDALSNIELAGARDPLQKVIDGGPFSDADVIALGRLNSFCVTRWYEPLVTLLDRPLIDPDIAALVNSLLPKLVSSSPAMRWQQ